MKVIVKPSKQKRAARLRGALQTAAKIFSQGRASDIERGLQAALRELETQLASKRGRVA